MEYTPQKPHHLKLVIGHNPTNFGFGVGRVELDGHPLSVVHGIDIRARLDDWVDVTLTLKGVNVEVEVPHGLFSDANLHVQQLGVDPELVRLAQALVSRMEESANPPEEWWELKKKLACIAELHTNGARFPIAVAQANRQTNSADGR